MVTTLRVERAAAAPAGLVARAARARDGLLVVRSAVGAGVAPPELLVPELSRRLGEPAIAAWPGGNRRLEPFVPGRARRRWPHGRTDAAGAVVSGSRGGAFAVACLECNRDSWPNDSSSSTGYERHVSRPYWRASKRA